jgi:SP family sugar porter-like MFS transporter
MSKYNQSYLLLTSLVSAMGGLLFGYDWVVIGGAKPFYEVFFNLSGNATMQGWAVSCAVLGCLLGVTTSGMLADRYGRKRLMSLAAVLFTASAVGTGWVDGMGWFIFYRSVGGVGIGIASNVSPMYIAEMSPAAVRGRFVSIQQLAIVLGILAAQVANWLIAEPTGVSEWNVQMGWRWMFWAETLPAALFFVLVFFIPESPRWLALNGYRDKAEALLARIGGSDHARMEIAAINESASAKASGFGELLKGKVPRLLLIGVALAALQQWCGINVIFNYAQEVFAAAGYSVSDTLFNIVVTGVTNVVFTFVGMYTVDKLGRRALMLFGAASLTLVYAVMGACYYFGLQGLPLLVMVVLTIACYAMTLAPVVWVLLAEIFPNRVRGAAMAISTFALWAACFVLTYTFPHLNAGLGASGTFWLYGAICAAGFLFVLKMLPETKGKSLEEVERIV